MHNAAEIQISTAILEKNMEIPQNTTSLISQKSHSKETESTMSDTISQMLVIAMLAIAKKWEQGKCVPTDKWIDNMT